MTGPRVARRTPARIVASLCCVAALSAGPAPTRPRTAPQEPPTWCATDAPLLRIGELQGDAEALDRVTGAHRFADGSVVVANAGSYELRFFDAEGRFRRSFRMPEADGFVVLEDVFADGSSVAAVSPGYRSDETATGVHRAEVRLLEPDPEGTVRRDLGVFPGDESYALSSAGSMIVGPLVFGASLDVAVSGDGVLVGITDEPDLRLLSAAGERRIALDVPAQRTTGDEFREEVERYLEAFPPDARKIEARRFDDMPRLEVLPLFEDLRTDAAGRIWVRNQLGPGEPRRMWTVLDPSGEPIARMRTPDGAEILELGVEHVVVLTRDELDVERVEVRPLQRTGCASPR